MLLLLAAFMALSLSCSGDKEPGSGDGGSSGGGGSGGDGIGVASLPKPVKVDLPPGEALLGPNDDDTVKAITDAFTRVGLNLNGIQLFVFPVADAHESLLVMNIDATKLAESDDEAYTALFDLPEVKAGANPGFRGVAGAAGERVW